MLLGNQYRAVITTHRLFIFSKKFMVSRLEIVWLARVTAVLLGHKMNPIQLLLGVALCVLSFLTFRENATAMLVGACMLTVGLLLVLSARKKVMCVSTGSTFPFGIALRRFRSEESREFAETVFKVLNQAPRSVPSADEDA